MRYILHRLFIVIVISDPTFGTIVAPECHATYMYIKSYEIELFIVQNDL